MNILSFDIEEWYLYNLFPKGGPDYFLPIIENYLDKLLFDLDTHDVKATFFILGIMAREYPHVVKKIHSRGHDIGCHSDKHKLIHSMTPDDFFNDSKMAIDSLEQIVGEKIVSYRAPAFSITNSTAWALEILSDLGITTDSSIFNGKRRRGGFDSFPSDKPTVIELNSGKKIYEFVMSNYEVFNTKLFYSGGGYFRLLPYRVIKKLFQSSRYNISYFHIRDFDKYQKKIISYKYPISYWGINSSYNKFNRLLDDFDFVSLKEAKASIDWSKHENVKIKDLK